MSIHNAVFLGMTAGFRGPARTPFARRGLLLPIAQIDVLAMLHGHSDRDGRALPFGCSCETKQPEPGRGR